MRRLVIREEDGARAVGEEFVPAELVADPFDRFLRLVSPTSKPSPPDDTLAFTVEPLDGDRRVLVDGVVAFSPNGTDPPAVWAINAGQLRRIGSAALDRGCHNTVMVDRRPHADGAARRLTLFPRPNFVSLLLQMCWRFVTDGCRDEFRVAGVVESGGDLVDLPARRERHEHRAAVAAPSEARDPLRVRAAVR